MIVAGEDIIKIHIENDIILIYSLNQESGVSVTVNCPLAP